MNFLLECTLYLLLVIIVNNLIFFFMFFCMFNDDGSNNKSSEEAPTNKSITENNPYKSKPSLIPKLTSTLRNVKRSSSLGRTEKQSCLVPSFSQEEMNEKRPHLTVDVSSRMKSLQDKLKVSTSLIKEKINNTEERSEVEKHKTGQNEKPYQLRFNDECFERQKREKKLYHEFSKHINILAQEATYLREINNLNDQIAALDNMYNCITKLKIIYNKINFIQTEEHVNSYVTNKSQDINDNQPSNFESENKTKTKDNNKIYIKLLPAKSGLKKRKGCNTEVQTEFTKPLECSIPQSDSKILEKKSNGETGIKDVDSMDGMFVPSTEEPPKMEEDEDEEGLDITITFPEFQQHIIHQASSHLSVCFSDISAESLCRLKRCPKEFTLRMDFVNGKMFFKSGSSPANNFSIGPDFKITECVIDDKMSDIISIKPSTECMYTSQIIPVEGEKRKSSIKTLKSTDSELFTVVSLPRISRKTSGNTKSCITFKSERCFSTGSLLSDRRSYKSMPQIPSLTRILEESVLESVSTSGAAIMNSEKKQKSRSLPKKRTSASLDKLPEA